MADQGQRPVNQFSDLLKKGVAGAAEEQADRVVKAGLAAWWKRADPDSKAGVVLICTGVAIGPLGQGLLAGLGVLFADPALPTSKQIYAVFWLLVLTAPVAAFVVIVVAGWDRAHPVVVFGAAGLCCFALGAAMGQSAPPKEVAGIYCYAGYDGEAVYEKECRRFDSAGFVRETADDVASASRSPAIFAWALAYTVDARGSLMVFASLLASTGIAMLTRRHLFGPS